MKTWWALLPVAALCGGCLFESEDRAEGGGSSETTNGVVVGYVRSPDGSPARNAKVTLRPRDFLKDPGAFKRSASSDWKRVAEAFTDSLGRFAIDSVAAGDFFLEASDTGKLGVLIPFSAGGRDTVTLDARRLARTGKIVGRVSPEAASGAYVQIFGLDRAARAGADGAFALENLPPGTYSLRAASATSGAEPRVLAAVSAQSEDTTDVGLIPLAVSFADEDYSTWPFSKRMVLNTTPSGANVARDISDFPVLVRLSAANFDFSGSDGKDLRFSDKAGKRLRYQVERWDTASRQAEVWVRVDTVKGNSRSDPITMHWGRPGSPDRSDGRSVFDTASGYAGVWHLGEEAADTTAGGLYRDATAAAQHGDDRIREAGTAGMIGGGHAFRAGDHIPIQPSAALRPADYVYISAWFRGDTADVSGATLAGLGDSYGLRVEPDGNVRMFVHKSGTTWPLAATTGLNVLDSSWHHLVGLFTSGYLHVYVDGVERAKVAASAKIPYTLGNRFHIGRHGNGKTAYDLTGHLDEVMVINRLRGVHFVKLCFESQRLNPTLLEFDP